MEAFPHFQMLLCKPALQKQETYLCAQCSQHTSQWTKVLAYQVWPSSEEAPQNSCFPNFYELVDTMALWSLLILSVKKKKSTHDHYQCQGFSWLKIRRRWYYTDHVHTMYLPFNWLKQTKTFTQHIISVIVIMIEENDNYKVKFYQQKKQPVDH